MTTTATQSFLVRFGDGTWCWGYDVDEDVKNDCYKFWLYPTQRIYTKFKKVYYEMNHKSEDGKVIRYFPRTFCHHIDRSAEYSTWSIDTDFEGNETIMTEKLKKIYQERVQLQQENESLRKLVARSNYQLKQMAQHPQQFKKHIIEELKREKELLNVGVLLPKDEEGENQDAY